jgi:pyruvate dehydrogenase phosphatase
VFDGHGGDKLSEYCANNIVGHVDSYIEQNLKDPNFDNNYGVLITNALMEAYKKIDKDFYENVYKNLVALNNRKIKNVGTCALTVLIYEQRIYVANCGDSEAIAVSKDPDCRVEFTPLNDRLSVNNPQEQERLRREFPNDKDIIVEDLGGSFYVKGRLQPTSTLGDYYLKFSEVYREKGPFNGPYIRSEPAIKVFPITYSHKVIVVASDGVWDFLDKTTVAEASLQFNPHEEIL